MVKNIKKAARPVISSALILLFSITAVFGGLYFLANADQNTNSSAKEIIYSYDESGERTMKNESGKKTYYINKYYEEDSDGTTRRHIYSNGVKVATVTTGATIGATIGFHHQDHLGSSNLSTDSSGKVVEVNDYYPYGSSRIEERAGNYKNNKLYTGKELDRTSGLYYYGARYYDPLLGRFTSVDPVITTGGKKSGKNIMDVLENPQMLNAYSYAANNPLRYTDPTGEWAETFIDIISLALSVYDFNKSRTIINGIFVALDGAGTATPLPAVFGYAKNSNRLIKITNYFRKTAKETGVSALKIGKTFLTNITFKFSRRSWSVGKAGNDVASLSGHFIKHGDGVGAKNIKEYYKKANDLIGAKGTYTIQGKNGKLDYFDPDTKLLTGVNKDGAISTFHKVTDEKKLKELLGKVKKQTK